ncbi:NAD(P)/FAD-dependent oxidoreductase [Crossiella cryophila]|uniref:2-polyprenyl-6-methoxyphenol hydroxylase-like FAD-dependent oxidoreductase n=1 Tax=Crossiella cryophila TaxID=43355 RepID=A0A7W7CCN1_9PSEU|nr:FAD-dependent oxidoreductase [Crossiella cryophila]MBB4678587.1 2-polyprenyl-6-methoxyphenol hydroxylase-like FAD-dependent oxidoreductase [Crossiella cryophila]
MADARHDHAVVIGAGIAGLLAARVLADHFTTVTLLERDLLPDEPASRPGTPQARHPHSLLTRGAEVFESLFPGLREELRAGGAPVIDFCQDVRFRFATGLAPQPASGILAQPVSRPLLEHLLRQRVRALGPVTIRSGCQVTALLPDHTGRRVRGVRVLARGHRPFQATTITARLVVDASGRSSRLPAWLADLGLPLPHQRTVDPGVGYATRVYLPRPGAATGHQHLVQPLRHPDARHGCFATTVENGHLLVALHAAHERPPRTDEEFTAFVATLDRGLAEATAARQPAPSIARYSYAVNRRVHYHRLRRWPDGLLALGDAVCAFNPIYGQGMAVAAMEAQLLEEMLTRQPSLDGLPRRFQRRLARLTRAPWLLASSADRCWQPGRPSLAARVARWYLRRLQRLIPSSPTVFLRFARVLNMLDSPAALAHPSVLWRVLLDHRRQPRRRQP